MKNKIFIAAASVAFAAPLQAQSVTGATASANMNSYDGISTYSLEASAEYGINPAFGIGGSVMSYGSDEDGAENGTNATLRGLYYTSPSSALGLFYSVDNTDGETISGIGAEWGLSTANGAFEAYYAALDSDDFPDELTAGMGGIAFDFRVASDFFVTFGADAYAVTDGDNTLTQSTATIGAKYMFDQGFGAYAEYGSLGITVSDGITEASASTDFIGIGVVYDFGQTNGAILNARSLARPTGY